MVSQYLCQRLSPHAAVPASAAHGVDCGNVPCDSDAAYERDMMSSSPASTTAPAVAPAAIFPSARRQAGGSAQLAASLPLRRDGNATLSANHSSICQLLFTRCAAALRI